MRRRFWIDLYPLCRGPLFIWIAVAVSEATPRGWGSEPPQIDGAVVRTRKENDGNSNVGGDGELGTHLQAAIGSVSVTDFHGHPLHQFEVDGVGCKLAIPKNPRPDGAWLWRARFWDHRPTLDLALLKEGWCVGYCDVADLFGSDVAIDRWDHFYDPTQQLGLHPRPVLEGFSRGGLVVMRWAQTHPERVAGVYVDNAVMDIRSWPGGFYATPGSPEAWERCRSAYATSGNPDASSSHGPLDRLDRLAAEDIPIYVLVNEADTVVLPRENSDRLIALYRQLNGRVIEQRRPGLDHHPHSLDDPQPLVEFANQALRRK